MNIFEATIFQTKKLAKNRMVVCSQVQQYTEFQIREGIEDSSKIIFLSSQRKRML